MNTPMDGNRDNERPVDWALSYAVAGLSVVPIACDGTKQPPPGQTWKYLQKRIADEAEIRRMFDGDKGIAIINGKVSGNLETLDIDAPGLVEPFEAAVRELVSGLLDRLPTVATPRNNWGGRHYRYRIDGTVAGNTKLAQSKLRPQCRDDGSPDIDVRTGQPRLAPETLIETRGEGGYAIALGSPPECHETGLPYKHVAGPPLTEIPVITVEEHQTLWHVARSFNRFVDQRDVSDAPTDLRKKDSPGDAFNAAASWDDILLPAGWEVDHDKGDVTYWRRPGKSKGVSATTGVRSSTGTELLCVFSTNAYPFEGPVNGRACSSYSKFAAYAVLNHSGDFSAAARVLRVNGHGGSAGQESASPECPKIALPELYQPFPVAVLPEPVQTLVSRGTAAIGCDAAYIALPVLSVLAGVIGNTRRIQLKYSWSEPAVLWTAIVGESGTQKSPAFSLAIRELGKLQDHEFELHKERMEDHQRELIEYTAAEKKWKSKPHGEPPKKPEPPQAVRFLMDDTTIEALAEILKHNPRGGLVASDEIDGWLQSFSQYKGGRGGDVSRWLSMHVAGRLIVDRKSGPPANIRRACVSIAGGIQPRTLRDALGFKHIENGLCARILFAMPPRRPRRWTDDDVEPSVEAEFGLLLDRLRELRGDESGDEEVESVCLKLDSSAREEWIRFYNEHANEQNELSGELAAAWSKLEAYAARLALIIHLVRWAARDESLQTSEFVDAESIRAGINLARWFGKEAKRVYATLSETDEERDRYRLAEWVAHRSGSVTARQVQQGNRRIRSAGAAEEALQDLVDAGYGQWEPPPAGRPGQPTRRFALSADYGISAKPEQNSNTVDVDGVDDSKTTKSVNDASVDVENDDSLKWGEI